MGGRVATTLRKGIRLGKYRLESPLGSGAFAEVWKATDMVVRRPVALKVVHEGMVEEWGRDEIEHEARMASRLHHPNIVGILNADWADGRFVMASQLARTHLGNYVRARRSPEVALRVARDVAAGLAHAHARKIMHRDVKPENVLVFPDGRFALTDFGVARFAPPVTRNFTDVGTLGYIAPEQAYGRPALGSDVFSLGLIVYHLLTGKLPTWPFHWPFEGHPAFRRKVPALLQPVLRKAAEFDPRRRYTSAVELDRALTRTFARLEDPKPRRSPLRQKKKAAAGSPLTVQAEVFRRAHGAKLDMRFRCHRCDGPISEAMVHCPWCGSADNSFREVTRSPLVCPECERGVQPEWTACPWCYAGRFEGNGRRPPPDPRAERSCTKKGCTGELQPFMRYCPVCKQKARRPWSHPELTDRCLRCRWPVSHDFWHFCPWCGRREPRAGTFKRTGRNGARRG